MVTYGSGASAGATRGPNEDAYLVDDGLGLYVVCDGMAAGPGGEVASATALEALERYISRGGGPSKEGFIQSFTKPAVAHAAVRRAVDAVIQAAEADETLAGMATTVTAVLAYRDRMTVSHVGDSRAYLMRGPHLHQLTSDSEWTFESGQDTEEAYDRAPIQVFSFQTRTDDLVLLCTHGAADVVEEEGIPNAGLCESPRDIASGIVRRAHEREPGTDATVVAVRVLSAEERGWLWLSQEVNRYGFGHALLPTR
jgi:protein phosphatase